MGSKFITLSGLVLTNNNDVTPVVKASSLFGGMTIVAANYVPGASTNAGTSHHLYLVNYGVSGTVSGGTVGDCGGTASPFTGTTPAAFALTAANVFVNAGQWLYLKKTQEGADSDIIENGGIVIEYVDGVVSVGA